MKKRKDCFFGLHFDFHAQENHTDIGKNFDELVLEELFETVKPDFVQCDTKGHPGISSYPTKAGNPAPQIHTDILRKWRDATKKYNIPLYAHYSGVWDNCASRKHPQWAAVDADGNVTQKMSVFGEYSEKLLIPQLKEIALDYGLDGVWVDGDCWSTVPDYSDAAKAAYKELYGSENLPKTGEADYRKFQDFCRKGFFDYLKNYITEVKKSAPDYEIASNWMNSSHVPDDINITDYISGDLEPYNSAQSARMEGRIIADFGRPWDLMAWGFRFPIMHVKTAVMLCQEAACAISLGGGFQIYNSQLPDKAVKHKWVFPILKEVADFCREREVFCHKAKPVHEAAVLLSVKAFYEKKETLFGRSGEYIKSMRGMLNALLDNQISTEILLSHNAVKRDLSKYSLIAVSNSYAIENDVKERLINYAYDGGALILSGADTVKLFAADLDIEISEKYETDPVLQISSGVMRDEVRQPYVKLSGGNADCVINTMNITEVQGDLKSLNPAPVLLQGETVSAIYRTKYGKGTVTVILFDAGTAYASDRSCVIRDFIGEALSASELKLKISGSHYIDTALMQKDGKTYIHLINMAGEHRDESAKVFDEIPLIYNINVEYKCDKPPLRVTLLPENKTLNYTYEKGIIKFKVDELKIHSAAEIF